MIEISRVDVGRDGYNVYMCNVIRYSSMYVCMYVYVPRVCRAVAVVLVVLVVGRR